MIAIEVMFMIPNLYSSLSFSHRLIPDAILTKLVNIGELLRKVFKFKINSLKFDSKKPLIRGSLIILCSLVLNACQTATVPLEFAPDGNIVQKAIALQLSQRLNPLSQQLNTQKPQLDIGNINVKNIDRVVISELPTYHLQGTYNLQLILPRQKVKQNKNKFDVYLQRQAEGKTWRLLSKENKTSIEESPWKSYLIMSQE